MMKIDELPVIAQASFQFCGHVDDYLIRRAREVVLVYFQTRFGKGDHLVRRYVDGTLVEERAIPFSGSMLGYYLGLRRVWLRELDRFRAGKTEVAALFMHPLLSVGLSARRNVRSIFWQWDYFPGRSVTERLFNWVADRAARRSHLYLPLTSAIARAMNRPEAKPLMLGVVPPTRFGTLLQNRILMVGQLRRGQGIEELLGFVSTHAEYSLALMGASANGFGEEIRRRAAEGGLSNRVYFPDAFVSDAELREIAATCFVSLALYDRSPNNLTHYADPGKVKSSIEMGLPVVMTRISEIVPYVERFKAGEVIDSVSELPQAIEKIRGGYATYQAGCRAFAEHFDCARLYDGLLLPAGL